jgi:hypothetical protein
LRWLAVRAAAAVLVAQFGLGLRCRCCLCGGDRVSVAVNLARSRVFPAASGCGPRERGLVLLFDLRNCRSAVA